MIRGIKEQRRKLVTSVSHRSTLIPDKEPHFRYPWMQMSIGSHFTIRSHDKKFLKAAVRSMYNFRERYAPTARFTYRKTRRGYTFWRVE